MIEHIIACTIIASLFASLAFIVWIILAHNVKPLERIMYKTWFFVLASIVNFVTFTSWTTLIIASHVFKIPLNGEIGFIMGNVGLLVLMGSYVHSYRTYKTVGLMNWGSHDKM